MDTLKEEYKASIDLHNLLNDRLVDINKWFLTIISAIIGGYFYIAREGKGELSFDSILFKPSELQFFLFSLIIIVFLWKYYSRLIIDNIEIIVEKLKQLEKVLGYSIYTDIVKYNLQRSYHEFNYMMPSFLFYIILNVLFFTITHNVIINLLISILVYGIFLVPLLLINEILGFIEFIVIKLRLELPIISLVIKLVRKIREFRNEDLILYSCKGTICDESILTRVSKLLEEFREEYQKKISKTKQNIQDEKELTESAA